MNASYKIAGRYYFASDHSDDNLVQTDSYRQAFARFPEAIVVQKEARGIRCFETVEQYHNWRSKNEQSRSY
jgi:hypothetical protein